MVDPTTEDAFRFTRDLLPWLHRHAPTHTVEALARGCDCSSPSTIEAICRRHGIKPSPADITGDDPPRFRGMTVSPKLAPDQMAKLAPRPELNPVLRQGACMLHPFEVKTDRGTTTKLNIEAAQRRTTAAVLGAVLLERVVARGMIAKILEE
jgi:hypothetical protein